MDQTTLRRADVRSKLKILLTGKNGQLGFELQRALAPLGQVLALGHQECDLADPAALRRVVRATQPNLIVNPAAYTAVDRAETEVERAYAINAIAPGILGEEAARIGAGVIHYSTDYVFDGRQALPYKESAATQSLNVYGQSKRAGELALQASCSQHCILRTSWVFGAHGNNFAKTILRLAAERDSLNIVADQYGAPTSAALLADITAQLIGRELNRGWTDFPAGLYHLTASGVTTWHAYACFIVEQERLAGRVLKLQPSAIQAIRTDQYPLPAARPAHSQLDTSLFQTTFGLTLPDWQSGVAHILQHIRTL